MNRDYHLHEVGRILLSAFTQITIPKGVIAAGVAFWAWLSPSEASLNIIGGLWALVILDFITGIRVSLKRGKFLQSRLWNRLVDKGVAYGVLAFLALTLPKYAPNYPLLPMMVDTAMALVAGGEFISVLENLSKLGVPVVGKIADALKIRVSQLTDELVKTPEPKQEAQAGE